MNFNIAAEYSLWYILLCIMSGGVYSFLLYYRDIRLREFSQSMIRILAVLRFMVVAFISFFLLNPLIKTIHKEVEKPVIIIAQDNTQSVIIGGDSASLKNEYMKKITLLADKLSEKYEVATYSFGSEIAKELNFKFDQKETDISSLFDELNTKYSNRNTGALILVTDGIYNKGANPLYSSAKLEMPIYTVAMGDTIIKKDVILKKVYHNRFAYLGSEFPMEILIEARQCAGERAKLSVAKSGKEVFSKIIDFTGNFFSTTTSLQLETKETGIQQYKISISHLDGEITFANNTNKIFIDVLDSRQKILILADAPHPDIAAIRQAAETNENYEPEVKLASDLAGKPELAVEKYNLIILHQLPSSVNRIPGILSNVVKSDVPVLYIIGSKTDLNAFNILKTGIEITGGSKNLNETQAIVKKDFILFKVNEQTRNFMKNLPPLNSPFGNYRTTVSANIMAFQKIGMVETENPLIVFNTNVNVKAGIIAGEGLWKWKLRDYEVHENNKIFNELVNNIVQFLSVKSDKSLFRISCKNNFNENEPVQFGAEVYNESYELINDPEVNINIIDEDGKRFPFTFSRTAIDYRLNAGMFGAGEYRYEATVKPGDKILNEKGEFSVSPLQIESVNTVADHNLLNKLASKSGGEMFLPAQLDELVEKINSREDIKSVSYIQKQLKELINMKWVFFFLLALLSAEWFLRKRSGAY